MPPLRLPRLRFSLKSLLILVTGIAIGYSLNLRMLLELTSAASEARKLSLPTYIIEPPDILEVHVEDNEAAELPGVEGQQLVAMDGRVNLGKYGSVYVAGMTIAEARDAIVQVLEKQMSAPRISLDVLAYNSKVYYVIQQGGAGLGAGVTRLPVTGNETVLDAIAHIGGLKDPAGSELWIARPAPNGVGAEQILPVDWQEVSTGAKPAANYQLLPGDRLFISKPQSTTAVR